MKLEADIRQFPVASPDETRHESVRETTGGSQSELALVTGGDPFSAHDRRTLRIPEKLDIVSEGGTCRCQLHRA
ncbi:MAG TPA: hypothetical protein PLK19_09525 [Mycobacterium sp.]|nr:hypothetical protein [Mycobacterium sp.]